MISGNKFWEENITKDLTKVQIRNQEYETFKGLRKNMYQVVKENAAVSPDKIGIVDTNGKTYTYLELLEKTNTFSSYLNERYGISKGHHIGVVLFNSIEFIVSFLAAQRLGEVMVPLPTKYKEPEICSLIEKSNCNLLITDQKFYSWVQQFEVDGLPVITCEPKDDTNEYAFEKLIGESLFEVEEPSLEDIAILMFTSGTTSFSKGVPIKNINIQHVVVSYRRILHVNEQDSTILSIPIYNVTGLVATLALFLECKGTLYLHRFFDPIKLLEDIKKYKITFFHASPTIFNLILREKDRFPDLPNIHTFVCGSGNMPEKIIKELKEWFPDMAFRTVYGLSETTSPATIFPSDAATSKYIGSSGIPIPGLQVKIVDDNEVEVNIESPGEVCLKGTNVIEAYYPQRESYFTKDHWLKTGDIGYLNQDGYLYIVDRKKDLINRGGEKIFSFDIENAIHQIEGIKEVAVVGVKHEMYGETPIAVISLKQGYKLNEFEINDVLKRKLASYEIPSKYIFVDEVLKTENGKIDKKGIRNSIEEGRMLR